MQLEELEFLISQYLDGMLSAPERAHLEARRREDPAVRALFEEYERLNHSLKSLPLPAVRWEALSAHLSSAVARLDEPAQTYKLPAAPTGWQLGFPRRLALAAALLLTVGAAFQLLRSPHADRNTATVAMKPIDITIDTAASEPAPAASPITIAIGPSDRLVRESAVGRYSDDVVSRSSQVLIASSARPMQDIGGPF